MESGSDGPVSKGALPSSKSAHPVMLFLTAIIVTAMVGLFLWAKFSGNDVTNASTINNLIAAGFATSSPHKLSPEFKDANGNLVADPPTDESRYVDPATLVFCFVATDDAEKNKLDWKPFTDFLSKATGKPVDYLLVTSTHDEVEAMQDGHLQVAGFNTGGVPPAVNLGGFVPVCAIPTPEGGALTHTDIIVPANSPLQKPEDLKGHELTLTDPASNSGYKAPLVLLKEQFGLQPLTDLSLRYSYSHFVSIAGVAAHRYESAAVADDILQRQIAAGKISPSQIRTIYQSESFPTAGLGYVYNLKPELAQKVRAALLSFDWKGTSLEKVFESGKQTKFVPVNYKTDWALVRRIYDQMGDRTGF